MADTAQYYAQQAQELCVLPDVYTRLKQMLDDEETTLAEISDVIALDPALASKLLKIANSALFGFPKQIDSITRALAVLGLAEVTNLINAYGVTAAFSGLNPEVLDMDRFWEISIDCALLTKFLAKKIKLKNSEGLFLSGLMHNIGELAIVHSAPKKVQYCEQFSKEDTPWERQLDVFGFTFSDCSAELLDLWQLPESIIEPIKNYRHAYAQELPPTSSLLFITTRLALINSHPGMYSKKSFLGQHLMEDLGISSDDIEQALTFCNAEGMSIMSALKVI
ncbi:HDOD domain-containing protein [Thalassotalea fusca]